MSTYFLVPVDRAPVEVRAKLEKLKSQQERLDQLRRTHLELVAKCRKINELNDSIQADINRDIAKLEMEMSGFVSTEGMTIQ